MQLKKIFLSFLLFATALPALAEVRDTMHVNIREYNNELGFYQKANRDLGDPRFMFYDDKTHIEFGVGGTVRVTPYVSFAGETSQNATFLTGTIEIPTNMASAFGTVLSGTEVHFKARSYIGEHKIIAYLQMGARMDGSVGLKQAYISFNGLSAGIIPSFFMDLEVGAMTIGLCPEVQVEKYHPLIGYTHLFGKNWSAGLAVEHPGLDLSAFSFVNSGKNYGVDREYQPAPDISVHAKYRWDSGHLQVSGLFRNMVYRSFKNQDDPVEKWVNRYRCGYGVSLSGNYKPVKDLKLSFQAVYGAGISNYISHLAESDLELYLAGSDAEGYSDMAPIPLAAGMLSAQYNFGKCSVSLVGEYNSLLKKRFGGQATSADDYKDSFAILGNFFWNITNYAYIGIEYNFGMRFRYPMFGTNYTKGMANRLYAVLAYCF